MLRVNVYDWNTRSGGWELLGYWFRDPVCGHWHYHNVRPVPNMFGRFSREPFVEFIRHRSLNYLVQASQGDAGIRPTLLKLLKDKA